MMNIVIVVCELCKPFEGFNHTILCHFYASVPLMKYLEKISRYVPEKVMKNRLPEKLKINKNV